MIDRQGQPEPDYRDRSVGLAIFGVIEILIGLVCALLIPLIVVAAVATRQLGGPGASPDLRSTVPSLVVYAVIAVAFVWLGVGSILARRWARALMLVLSWLWLVTGVVAMMSSWWLLPAVWAQVGGMTGLPGGALLLVRLTTALLLGFIYVALPAAFVLFYRSPDVAATCRARDPNPSWVDDCPPHLVSLVLVYALGAVSVLTVPAYGFVLPVFGVVLDGAAGAAGWAIILALLIGLAWATARRDLRAWRVGMAGTGVAFLATTVTVAAVPVRVLVERMRLPPEQTALLEAIGLPGPAVMVLLSVLAWGTFAGYLAWTRRFFGPAGERS